MKRILSSFSAILVCLLFNQTIALASSHREAPLISNDPMADNTDLYAFRSPCDPTKVVLIANYIPLEHPAGGPNYSFFGQNIRYEIHVDNNAAVAGDEIVYRFEFSVTNEDPTTFFNIRLGKQNLKNRYTMSKSVNGGAFVNVITNGIVPPNNIGPRSITSGVGLGAPSYESLITSAVTTASTGEEVFCGQADDPFFVDLGGAFDVGTFRKQGRDAVAKSNIHSICIQVPISSLQKTGRLVSTATSILDGDFVIGVYAAAYRKEMTTLSATGDEPGTSGNFIQVSRLGMPLTNEAIIPIGMKDKWNATSPSNDLQFAENFKNPELALYMAEPLPNYFGAAVPGLADLRIQTNSLNGGPGFPGFDFRNNKEGLWRLKGNPALVGTALDPATFGNILLPDNKSPRAVDILPIFYTGVPNLSPYQLATGKTPGAPLTAGKPFINNFLPTLGDYLRLNMAVPVTPRNSPDFSSLGLVRAAVLGLTDSRFNTTKDLQNIPNMDGFPNGRRLEDDVTTIELQAVGGVVLAAIGFWYDDWMGGSGVSQDLVDVISFHAGVTRNDTTFKSCFPFVQSPWAGFTGAQFIGPTICQGSTDRLYVDATASASNTSGSSWGCALRDLSEAIKIANVKPSITSIWVADGTYKPTSGSDRTVTMSIKRANLRIIGGFSGNETMESQANPVANPAILSGDIGTLNNNSDNSFSVLEVRSVPASANGLFVDGFTIERGNSNNAGGGLGAYSNNTSTSIRFQRIIFRNNNATNSGGAVYLDNSNITFDSSRFITNTAGSTGGAMFAFKSSPVINTSVFRGNTAINGAGFFGNNGNAMFNKTVFTENTASSQGGGVFQNGYSAKYTNSVFNANTSVSGGGALFVFNSSSSHIVNSTFFRNATGSAGGAMVLAEGNSSARIENSIFYKNTGGGSALSRGADITNFTNGSNVYANNILQANTAVPANNGTNIRNNTTGADPLFVNEASPIGSDNIWGTTDDGLNLMNSSPAKNTGDNELAPAGTDITNRQRIVCAIVDRGAYENQASCGPVAEMEEFVTAVKVNNATGVVANPFSNDLQIRYMGTEKAGVSVSSASGKMMWNASNIKQGITRVDASSWSSGLYEVIITPASGKRINFKVVKL